MGSTAPTESLVITITVARRPLPREAGAGSVAANVLKHGTGALHVDAARIESGGEHLVQGVVRRESVPAGDDRSGAALGMFRPGAGFIPTNHPGGRWPANLILQHLDTCGDQPGCCEGGCPVGDLDTQSGVQRSGVAVQRNGGGQSLFGGIGSGSNTVGARHDVGFGDAGGASRYFKRVGGRK